MEEKEQVFAKNLKGLPGNKQPVSWGVYPLLQKDGLYVRWDGGGGYCDPLEQPPEDVCLYVTKGLVSREFAKSPYGVVITPDNTVDVTATEELRTSILLQRKSTQGGTGNHAHVSHA